MLFSRLGDPQIGPPNAFSFNTPSVKASGAILIERAGNTKRQRAEYNVLGGMCPGCDGTGRVSDLELSQLYDGSRSINDGAILVPGYKVGFLGCVRLPCDTVLTKTTGEIRRPFRAISIWLPGFPFSLCTLAL